MVLRSKRHFLCGRVGLASECNPQPIVSAGQTQSRWYRSAGKHTVSFPSDRISRFDPALFWAFLLRRFRLPLSLSVRNCWCGRPLDALGHHRAASTTSSKSCREGGARVRTSSCAIWNCCSMMDSRRLEIVAAGLPLHGRVPTRSSP